jgi:hypothetical protein
MTILNLDPTDDDAIQQRPESPPDVVMLNGQSHDDDDREQRRERHQREQTAETRALLAPWREKLLAFLLAESDAGQIAEIELEFYDAETDDGGPPMGYEHRNRFTFRSDFQEPRSGCGLGPKFVITLAREQV